MPDWIDFKVLRAQLRFADVLAAYRVEVKLKREDQHMGYCPLPTHQSKGRRSPSFSANLAKGIWRCFGCGAGGNALDFATRMEGLDPSKSGDVRKAATTLRERLGFAHSDVGSHRRSAQVATPGKKRELANAGSPVTPLPEKVIVNGPLDFTLKGLCPDHPYLQERGFTAETVERFSLGYCNRGLLSGRIAIPLDDARGRLLGYAGRITDDNGIDEMHPKYLFPSPRTRDGKTYRLRKSLFVYNAHRIAVPADDLVVVEGFPSVWWLTQLGFPNTVALMGASCSEQQAAAIAELTHQDARVWVMTDGDNAGRRCAVEALTRISPTRFCRWLQLPERQQPTDKSEDDLQRMFRRN